MKKISLLSLLFLLLSFSGMAQNTRQQQKDSLRNALTLTEGREKLLTYDRLSFLYFAEVNNEQVRDTVLALYAEKDAEAEKQGDYGARAATRGNILIVFFNSGMYDEIIKRAPEYLQFMAEHEQWRYYYQSNRALIDAYRNKRAYEDAVSETQKMYEHAKGRNDAGGMGMSFLSMSNIYMNQRRFEEQEKALKECIALLKDSTRYFGIFLDAYNKLGYNYVAQKRYDDAINTACEIEKIIPRYEAYTHSPQANARRMMYAVYTDAYLQSGRYKEAEIYLNKQDSLLNGSIPFYEERANILLGLKRYPEALEMAKKAFEDAGPSGKNQARGMILMIQIHMCDADGAMQTFTDAIAAIDSTHNMELNAQLDELRTQYEVDKHILEKEKTRNYLLFALGGCILLALALGVWMRYSSLVANKNRTLVRQIKELHTMYEHQDEEILNKTTFEPAEAAVENDFCPENRRDKLCIAIRDIMMKEKIYRNPAINREQLIKRLGTNRHLFDEAVQFCFGMSFPDYINYFRMKDSIKMLEESDMPIEIVAEKAGYGSLRTFQRQFRNRNNMSPKDYRKFINESKKVKK
jgi:AraC-like DNA-binding protein/tetratricopeptide (TPR) repeat protein